MGNSELDKQQGCLTCKHYNPNPRWNSTPVCMLGGCRYEPLEQPSPQTTASNEQVV